LIADNKIITEDNPNLIAVNSIHKLTSCSQPYSHNRKTM